LSHFAEEVNLMPTDIKLDQADGNWLLVEGNVLKATATDFMLDAPSRRRPGGSAHRRALVHDAQDGLTINFAGDYRGGVTVVGDLAVTGDVRTGSVESVSNAVTALQDEIFSMRTTVGISSFRLDKLENTVAQLVEMLGVTVIPEWHTKTEVEQGDDMGIVSPSAEQLGLVVEFQIDQRNPNFQHEDVISITPPAGTLVRRGTTVVVRINLEG
jgi:hypothetical protein